MSKVFGKVDAFWMHQTHTFNYGSVYCSADLKIRSFLFSCPCFLSCTHFCPGSKLFSLLPNLLYETLTKSETSVSVGSMTLTVSVTIPGRVGLGPRWVGSRSGHLSTYPDQRGTHS